MTNNKALLPQEIYITSLHMINGVKFSQREIEVLSCIFQMRTAKKIASILSIAPKTVESHIRNISQKLDCNSREGIIDIIEKSDKYMILRSFYSQFIICKMFEKICEEASKMLSLNSETTGLDNLRGKAVRLELSHEHSFLSSILKQHFSLLNLQDVAISVASEVDDKDSINFSHIFREQESYYYAFFHLLGGLFPKQHFDTYRQAFEAQCELLLTSNIVLIQQEKGESGVDLKINKNLYKIRSYILFSVVATLMLVGMMYYFLRSQEASPSIRSDLPIPADNALLNRTKLLATIEEKLNEQRGIQRIALIGVVGIGGVGKTTLARQFGRNKHLSIVWEINAETKDRLVNSFKDLAYGIAKTESQKKELDYIHNIKNNEEKEKQTLSFVRDILKQSKNWLLIFDNVESISKIKNYLPQDPEVWGKGNVIVTTRDSNIKNNNYIKPEHIIELGELNSIEALTLFSKILFNSEPNKLTQAQKEETIQFLYNIPSFPLDITIAAYYLKETKSSYANYLEHIKRNSEEFIKIQEVFLENIGDYVKTRYGIVTLSLQHLINSNPDFKDLLFFISLLDSQNIPKNLLKKYKSEVIVEDFVYNLKKYSLITSETSGDYKLIPSISIHRSTQHISLCYLTKPKEFETNAKLIYNISQTLAKYIADIGETKRISEIKLLLSHGNRFLSHRSVIDDYSFGIVANELGIIYFYMGDFTEAMRLFSQSYNIFALKKDEQIRAAKIALYMGAYYRLHLGDLSKAKTLTDYALKTYLSNYEKDNPDIAKALMYSALVHRCLGNYQEAKSLLERSVRIYEQNYGDNNVVTAEVMVYLGRIYTRLGMYISARDILEKGYAIFKSNLGQNHIEVAWTSVYLAEAYYHLGYYKKSMELLEKSREIYKQHEKKTCVSTKAIYIHLGRLYNSLDKHKEAKDFIEQGISFLKERSVDIDFRMTWALTNLGIANMHLQNYLEAKRIFNQALLVSKKHYGSDHVETANVLLHMGQNYSKEGDAEAAIRTLNASLDKFESNNHCDAYKAREALSDVYFIETNKLIEQKNIEGARTQYLQSIDHLKEAKLLINNHFPKDSPLRERIASKLNKMLEECKKLNNFL